MERLFDGKVYLEVWVKVKSGWNDDERLLKSLGYMNESARQGRWPAGLRSAHLSLPGNQPDR